MVGIGNDRNINIMPRDLRKQNKYLLCGKQKANGVTYTIMA